MTEQNKKTNEEFQKENDTFHTDHDRTAGFRILWSQAQTLAPSHVRRARTLSTIETCIAEKNIHHTPSYGELILIELQYISPFFWVLQGGFVVALIALLHMTSLTQRGLTDYLCWISVLAAWMGVAVCSDLGRHFSRKMAEVEQSCYFNFAQMWTIKMTLTGCTDILMLVFCCGKIASDTSLPFGQVCVYILVPFVLSNLCCLFVFTSLRSSRGRYGQAVLAFSTGLLAVLPTKLPPVFYTITFFWVWITALAIGTLLFVWQFRRTYGKIRRGEILCWN